MWNLRSSLVSAAVIVSALTSFSLSVPAADETDRGVERVSVTSTKKQLKLEPAQSIFGPQCDFEVSFDRKARPDATATVVCEVYLRKGNKDAHVVTVFHEIEMKSAKGKAKVHFIPVGVSLDKDAEMRLFLVKAVKPDPKPPHARSLLAGADVYTFEKPMKELKGVDARPISDVLKLPVKAP